MQVARHLARLSQIRKRPIEMRGLKSKRKPFSVWIPAYGTIPSPPASPHSAAPKHFDFIMGAIPSNCKINWLFWSAAEATNVSPGTVSLHRHLFLKKGSVWPVRSRGCSACPGGVSWGSDRQPWQIAWPSKTTVPCPPALNPETTVLPAGMPAPHLPAHAPASRRRTRCPFQAKLSGCELRRLGHASRSATSPTLGTASHRGEGAPGEAATLPRIRPGSILEVFYVVRLYSNFHSKESGCHPGTALCVPKGLPCPHVARSGVLPKSVANWELQQDALNVKWCDRWSVKWASPATGRSPLDLFAFPKSHPEPHSRGREW